MVLVAGVGGGREAGGEIGVRGELDVGGVEEGRVSDCKMGGAEQASVASKKAGLSRSTEMVSALPFLSTVKYLSVLVTTQNGPSYGAWRGVQVASCLTKT